MAKPLKPHHHLRNDWTSRVEIKSKFDAEFRRFSLDREKTGNFEEFFSLVGSIHGLKDITFIINYTDPSDGDLLPINNDDNFRRAINMAKPLLRLHVQRKGQSPGELNGYGTLQKKKTLVSKFIAGDVKPKPNVHISLPEDFRRVSAIIDVDLVPETQRRVKLMKNGSDKPLGFYIRDGTSMQVTHQGTQKVPGIFISRLVPGGLAESTGLLAVNDEVMEVNGIEVAGKTLDQVTDMMVANSSNLIITVKPVNQKNNLRPRTGGTLERPKPHHPEPEPMPMIAAGADLSQDQGSDLELVDEEEDEVKEYLDGAKDTVQPMSTETANPPRPVTMDTDSPLHQDDNIITL